MRGWRALAAVALALPGLCGAAAAELQRSPGETAERFAERVLGIAHVNALETVWNEAPAIFADYSRPNGPDDVDHRLVLLRKMPDGFYRKIDVTVGEEEGGEARIAAIGFANADRDPAQELIVILAWPTEHYDVSGTFYEVRVFDDAGAPLALLKSVSAHFGSACDCTWRDGHSKHFRFKTIAAVKAELKRMGF